jgi:GNAT superfamily N-acetyltransferase
VADHLKQAKDVQLRALSKRDLAAAHGLSLAVGWPHRLVDWQLVHRLGDGIAAVGADGALAGTAMWWPFGESFATIGMVIVSPERQGAGIGRQLMKSVLATIGSRSVQLNATAEGLRLYQATGFITAGSICQHQGTPSPWPGEGVTVAGTTRAMSAADRDAVLHIDHAATGLPRAAMLDALWQAGDGLVVERSGVPAGFAFRRPFGRGEVIGPVVSRDETDALALVASFVASARGFIRADVKSDAEKLVSWLESAGLRRVDAVTTMLRGAWASGGAGSRVFGIANQALG